MLQKLIYSILLSLDFIFLELFLDVPTMVLRYV